MLMTSALLCEALVLTFSLNGLTHFLAMFIHSRQTIVNLSKKITISPLSVPYVSFALIHKQAAKCVIPLMHIPETLFVCEPFGGLFSHISTVVNQDDA